MQRILHKYYKSKSDTFVHMNPHAVFSEKLLEVNYFSLDSDAQEKNNFWKLE